MEKRTKGYGNFINNKKSYSACTHLTIYKRLNDTQYYRDLTHLDFNSFTLSTPELFENFHSDFVLVFTTLKQKVSVACTFDDLFGICFNRYIMRNSTEASVEFNMIQHIKANINLKFVINEEDVMFFQANKSKGARNEYRIRYV